MSLKIAIIDQTGAVYDDTTSVLGGSETWTVKLSRSLARNSAVEVFTNIPTKIAHFDSYGVKWNLLDSLEVEFKYIDFDYVIITRNYSGLISKIRSWNPNCKIVVMAHDLYIWTVKDGRTVCSIHGESPESLEISKYVALTEYHKRCLMLNNGIPEDMIKILPNGIDFDDFKDIDPYKHKDNRLLFSSRPERGHELLSKLTPMVQDKIHDFGVDIASYGSVDLNVFQGVPNVRYLGNLTKQDLYKEMSNHAVWWYPSIYPETFNVSAIEAVLCGCIPVMPFKHAMNDTLKPYRFLGLKNEFEGYFPEDYEGDTDAALQESAMRIINEITYHDDPLRKGLIGDMIDYIHRKFDWKNIAFDWITLYNKISSING